MVGNASRGDRPSEREALRRDVLDGLRQEQKSIPSVYFYDRRGSELFDAICSTAEYYVTRTEMDLLRQHAGGIADLIGEGAHLVELGSCNTIKARILLSVLRMPISYMPVDVSSQHLWSAAMQLQLDHPYLAVRPLHADFTALRALPDLDMGALEDAVFLFFGSTIGNFHPVEALKLLKRISETTTRNMLLIGVDLRKDPRILDAAYNDASGFTAAFNLNLLDRINRELGGNFDLDGFQHWAFFNETCGRVEMHLRSRKRQTVRVGEEVFQFVRGETILTEYSYKYSIGQFHRLARRAGYFPLKAWTDPRRLFSLHLLCNPGQVH